MRATTGSGLPPAKHAETSPPPQAYGTVARCFHWLVVLMLIAQYALAWTMPNADKPKAPVGLIGWHVSIGLLIMVAMLLRLGWRLTHPAPPAPGDLPVVVQGISRLTHVLFYVILLIVPFLGWAMASSRGWDIRLFGLVPLPSLVAATSTDSALSVALANAHIFFAIALLVVVGLHVAGALFHLFVLRDDVTQRMLPQKLGGKSPGTH